MSIALQDLSKRFGQHPVINRISLDLRSAELFVLLGASGSGKSTILRLIAGLLPADSGRIFIDGVDVTELRPQERHTGFVFQNYALFKHMTVLENVAFGLRVRGVKTGERNRRAENLLELVGLGGLGQRFPEQMSGGQRQRVALARALVYEPKVLLLDEPFGALDVQIREQLRKLLKKIQRQTKVTTILVTHDQEEALELADRMGVVDQGRLVETGTPEDLYYRPRTETVATFIGGGNVLVGRCKQGRIKLGQVTLAFPAQAPPHEEGAPVRILFRPEAVIHADKGVALAPDLVELGEGVVKDVSFSGPLLKTRIELEALSGARPLMPRLVYGDKTAMIESRQPGSPEAGVPVLGGVRKVAVKSFHVLSPTGLKVLALVDNFSAADAAVNLACRLAEANYGSAVLLSTVRSGSSLAQARGALQQLRQQLSSYQHARIEAAVRSGVRNEQLVMEAVEGAYELVALPLAENVSRKADSSARAVLYQTGVPVLFTLRPAPAIKRILICTALGEPGKSDILFGGRLARHSGASACVLHVSAHEMSKPERERAEAYLDNAARYLNILGVENSSKILFGSLRDNVLSEAAAGAYDLLLVGAPGLPDQLQGGSGAFLSSVISNFQGSAVVVVPMQAQSS